MIKKVWITAAGSAIVAAAIVTSVSLFQNKLSAKESTSSTVSNTWAKSVVATRKVSVFRSPNCSCCAQWIKHLEAAGFQVEDNITEDLTPIKQQYGVPENLAACHTATVDSYVIEGHVPAEDILRLLAEKPDYLAGLAVPGMPIGSPGMESGDYVESYTVFSFTDKGKTDTFANHP